MKCLTHVDTQGNLPRSAAPGSPAQELRELRRPSALNAALAAGMVVLALVAIRSLASQRGANVRDVGEAAAQVIPAP